MHKLTTSLLLGALCIGCNASREPAPTPPAAMPATSPAAVASADQPSPTSSAFAPPPTFATAEPSASAAPLVSLSEPPTSPPPDLGPDARPVRYTKHVALKSLDGLSAAFKAPLDQYNTTLTVTHNDATQDVHNCAEYLKAVEHDMHAGNELDNNTEGFFREKCAPLWFLRRAWPSRKSHLGDLRFDIPTPLTLLPAVLDVLVSYDREEAQQSAIQRGDSLAAFHPGLKVTKKDALTLEWAEPKPGSLDLTLKIVAFGDVDHDGLEDVLLFQTAASREGTYRIYRHFAMTRKQEKGPLVVAMETHL